MIACKRKQVIFIHRDEEQLVTGADNILRVFQGFMTKQWTELSEQATSNDTVTHYKQNSTDHCPKNEWSPDKATEKKEEIGGGGKGTSSKASGPDGYTTEFYQASWKLLGKDIVELVEESRRSRQVFTRLNSTFVTLIRK